MPDGINHGPTNAEALARLWQDLDIRVLKLHEIKFGIEAETFHAGRESWSEDVGLGSRGWFAMRRVMWVFVGPKEATETELTSMEPNN